MNFHNKNILITGASSGIGAALAKQLASEAASLVLVARRREALEKLQAAIRAAHPGVSVYILPFDISVEENRYQLKKDLADKDLKIDILVNNAGLGYEALFHESDQSKLNDMIELNVKAVTSLTRLFAEEFVTAPEGKGLIFIGSGAGIAWMPGNAVYSASKHFITAFAMNLRAELKPLGIEVRLVAPGPVDTEFDLRAGIKGGMKGAPIQKTRISAEECAVDTLRLLKKSSAVVVPGSKIRQLMSLYKWLPWLVREKLLEKEGKKLYSQ